MSDLYLSSRGDQVRLRVGNPKLAGAPALLVLCGDGTASGADAARALSLWGSWAWIACPDLPLCGERSSDKLSDAAFDPNHALSTRLLPDLAEQLAADLEQVRGWLLAHTDLDPKKLGLVAWGRGARLAQHIDALETRFAVARIDADAEPDSHTAALHSALS